MTRIFTLSLTLSLTLAALVAPPVLATARACGDYGAFLDPERTAVEDSAAQHVQRSRPEARVHFVWGTTLGDGAAVATVRYERAGVSYDQRVELSRRGERWHVVRADVPARLG